MTYKPKQLNGKEMLVSDGKALDVGIVDFWRWGYSNVLNNRERGILAEYIVGHALDAITHDTPARQEWDEKDLVYQSKWGDKLVEVKSSAYCQAWHQDEDSQIKFSVAAHQGWDADTNTTAGEQRRAANVYVFCLLDVKLADKAKVDPLNLDQWRFWVMSTKELSARLEELKIKVSIGLKTLEKIAGNSVKYGGIKQAVDDAIAVQKEGE